MPDQKITDTSYPSCWDKFINNIDGDKPITTIKELKSLTIKE